jgi:mannose-6-phosphate isomerase-like protein (cupin superfamily)
MGVVGEAREGGGADDLGLFEAIANRAFARHADQRVDPTGVRLSAMETINGCTVVPPSEAPEPVRFGPADTQGAYVAMIGMFPPGQPAPPLHIHPDTDEAFYIADGDATFRLGDRDVPVTAGGLVFVPRGTAHTAWNSGTRPVRGLILVSPGGAEHVFVPVDTG